MATTLNLRYCQILHDSTYYDVIVGISTLDELNDVLDEWAAAVIGEEISLPEALIINTEAKDIDLRAKSLNAFVYIKTS